ncbi:MAG: GNAT family N-acetyltransferase [Gammaproteobacteria bacterium]|nr:GNAT family N-acetyltransferase [Gammaproteobacteria bacterium]
MLLVQRLANITDLDFIYSCILYGSRKGHFSFDVGNSFMVNCMKREMQSVVHDQQLLDQRQAQASIFFTQGKRIATLIMSEVAGEQSAYEIYAIVVARKFQHQGYGGQIIDEVLSHYPQSDIYARCAPGSDQIVRLLDRRGFRLSSIDDDYRVFIRESAHYSDITEPMYLKHSWL